ncbi:uncharacterized protein V1516DRAFT_673238 [Lipomyces oligophaga]|uniref:uncharacterized protein n=1 Tax=Lipomyces oligophaga TaxID=45792 RepID=UPI0034CF0429
MAQTEEEIDALLSRESLLLNKDSEIARILACFPLDSYSILDLLPGCPSTDIKAQYRRKSLLIHPDKTSNPDAPDAFNRLKKASSELLDDDKRALLDEIFADARSLLMRQRGWSASNPELNSRQFLIDWKEKVKSLLVDTELRRRRLANAALKQEGRDREKQESEIELRKRKRDHQKAWEDTRDDRITNWRDYKKTVESKKKSKKTKVLG